MKLVNYNFTTVKRINPGNKALFYHSNENWVLSILCSQMSKQNRKRNWGRIEWFTRSKLIVLVCLRTAMVLFAFNSIAPLLSLISNFLSAPSSSSTYMIGPKPDPVRLESKRMKFLRQWQFFYNINSQRFNSLN